MRTVEHQVSSLRRELIFLAIMAACGVLMLAALIMPGLTR